MPRSNLTLKNLRLPLTNKTMDLLRNKLIDMDGSLDKIIDTNGVGGLIQGAALKTVANAQSLGGVEVVHVIRVANVASGDTDLVITEKTRFVSFELVKTSAAGAATETVTVKNGATAITNVMDTNVADKAVVRPTTLDDAQWEIAAGGTLRASHVKAAGDPSCDIICRGFKVA